MGQEALALDPAHIAETANEARCMHTADRVARTPLLSFSRNARMLCPCPSPGPAGIYLGSCFRAAELMQYRRPVGCGPSSNTCPRWPPQSLHFTSVRTMP